jgi:hypothetical protein
MSALIEILLNGVNVTNSDMQAHRWAGEIITSLREQGYEITYVGKQAKSHG